MSDMTSRPISWDDFFMGVAMLAALRSKDPSTGVGACIASKDDRILSVGYNGTPTAMDDGAFPWGRDGDWLETKYPYVVHAERNAVLNFRGPLADLRGSTAYVTLKPCNECAKEMAQVGVAEVVYLDGDDRSGDEFEAAARIFEACGVRVRTMPVPGSEG